MAVVNVFGYRATDPEKLLGLGPEELEGPDNRGSICAACNMGDTIIAAWGAPHKSLRGRIGSVSNMLREKYSLKCLGKTLDGWPRHPLYLKADAPLIDWP